MADIAKARVPVEFDKAQIASDANSALQEAFGPAAANAAKLLGGILASREVVKIGHEGLDELIDREKVAAQTNVELRSELGITADQVESLGQNMMDLAGFDDEAAKSAANILLRFGAIHDEGTLKRVEQDAADLAVTMGTDLPDAAQQLGVILQNPENAARRLRPLIGQLTDSQKDLVDQFAKTGNVAGEQNVILQILEQRIGGAAKAYGDTLGGGLAKADANLTEAKASLVEGLTPALNVGSEAVVALAHGVEELPAPLRAVVSVATAAGVGIVGLIQPISGLLASFNSLRAARLLTAASAETDAVATTAEAAANAEAAAAAQALEAAQVQRIVSNEALVFSDAEIATALQARQAAEVQAIVSNEALIASDVELAAAETSAGASSGLFATALAGGQAGAAAAGAGLLALLPTVAAFALGIATAKVVWDNFIDGIHPKESTEDEVTKLTAELNQLGQGDIANGALQALGDVLENGGNKIKTFGDAAEAVFRQEIGTAGPAGAERFIDALEELQQRGILPTGVDIGKLRRELTDYKTSIAGSAGATDVLKQKMSDLDTQIQAAQQAQQQLVGAQLQAESGALGIASAQDQLRQAQEAATVGIAQQQLQLELNVRSAQRQLEEAEKAASDANIGVQAEHLQAQVQEAELAVQQARRDAFRARTPDEINKTQSALISAEDRLRQARADQANQADDTAKAQDAVLSAQLQLAQAQQAEADFTFVVQDRQRAVEQARLAVKEAEFQQAQNLANLADVQQVAITGTITEAEKLDNLRTALRNLATDLPGGTQALSDFADQLDRLSQQAAINTFKQLAATPGTGDFLPVFGTARAAGGDLMPGQVFTGAENDFEILMKKGLYRAPSFPTTVLNHDESVGFLTNGPQVVPTGTSGIYVAEGAIQVRADNPREGLDLAVTEMVWKVR